ncbi:hypothetical protein [Sinorhizobium fredii]|uniref:hypothetical protein n=1 Tax=Rhizobium fredii TaxID=380 RepID=UPI0004B9F8C0|nr:hypothetical protein [Sinorhizobium fredii]
MTGTLEKLMARRLIAVPISLDVNGEAVNFTAELRDPPLIESLPLQLQQQQGGISSHEYGLRTLAIYLWIDGKRITYEVMQAMGTSVCLEIGEQCQKAMQEMLGIETDEDGQPKPKKKGKAAATRAGGALPRPQARHDGPADARADDMAGAG